MLQSIEGQFSNDEELMSTSKYVPLKQTQNQVLHSPKKITYDNILKNKMYFIIMDKLSYEILLVININIGIIPGIFKM